MATAESVGFPSLAALALDRVRFTMDGIMAAPVNFVIQAQFSIPLFIVLCDRGPPTILGLGAPDQGANPRAQ